MKLDGARSSSSSSSTGSLFKDFHNEPFPPFWRCWWIRQSGRGQRGQGDERKDTRSSSSSSSTTCLRTQLCARLISNVNRSNLSIPKAFFRIPPDYFQIDWCAPPSPRNRGEKTCFLERKKKCRHLDKESETLSIEPGRLHCGSMRLSGILMGPIDGTPSSSAQAIRLRGGNTAESRPNCF